MDSADPPTREELAEMLGEDGVLDAAKFFSKPRGLFGPASIAMMAEVCGRPIKGVRFDGVQPAARIDPEHFQIYVPLEAKILSCRRKFQADRPDKKPQSYYVGIMDVGGDRFVYRSRMPLPLVRVRLIAFPTLEQVGRKIRPVIHVLAPEAPPQPPASEPLRSLADVRACYPLIVGEDVNVLLFTLALASRLNLNRDFWIMGIIVQGESSAGKSYLVDNILRPYRMLNVVEEFSRFTGPYLERKFRGRDMDQVIMVIYELTNDTPQQLHISLSEGRLRVGLVDRETGEALEYEFSGQPFLISTTPLESLRADLRNRVITVSIDESEEQTKRILEFETRLSADGAELHRIKREAERAAERIASHLKGLKPAAVSVPWAEKLYSRLNFYSTKLRRDWKKLLSLIQASALLFQHDRRVEEVDGVRTVYADRRDLENLLAVMPAFTQTIQSITPVQRRVLDLMCVETEEGPTWAGVTWTTTELVKKAATTGWRVSANRIRAILSELEALGYVVVERMAGRENKYERVRDYHALDLQPLLDEVPGPPAQAGMGGDGGISQQ